MSNKIQSLRGMHDILPSDVATWQYLERTVRDLFDRYGYSEIRTPIVEQTDLFKRAVGEVTDIVEKEMYNFDDRERDGKDSLNIALRPEGTAGCVRAGLQHSLFHNQQQRLWYQGPMFRRERPQKGRYRQFHQIGVETFGINGPDIDAELIALTYRLWQALGIKNVRLELNSLGTSEARAAYRDLLIAYFSKHEEQLDEDAKRRLHSNPLRILDTKNPAMKDLVAAAPNLHDHLDEESALHFQQLTAMLDEMGIEYVINPRLVRGLDYYSRTVFEWITDELGAQGTICAGGRYDGLVPQLGGKPAPAVGFAMGMERLIELLKTQAEVPTTNAPDVYFIMAGENSIKAGLAIAETLRSKLPALRLVSNCGGGSFKAQTKRADKSQAQYALILGENELATQTIILKPLRTDEAQAELSLDSLAEELAKTLSLQSA